MLRLTRPRLPGLNALVSLLIAAVVIGVAVFVGYRVGSVGLSYQDLVLLAMAVAAAVIVLHPRGLEIGFVLWVGLFVLGYRMTRVNVPLALDKLINGGPASAIYGATGATPALSLHPMVIVIMVLLVIRIMRQLITHERIPNWRLPRMLWVFGLFWLWGWSQGMVNGYPWPEMFPELLHFVMLFPIFIVSAAVLTKQRYWRPVVALLYFAGTFIAFFGLLEYAVPGFRDLLPGFVTASDPELLLVAQDGFLRGTFSFWGTNAAATFICVMALPMAVPLLNWTHRPETRLLIIVAGVVQLLGIYIGGYRSMWLTLAVIVGAMLYFRYGVRGLLLTAVVTAFVLSVLPDTALGRLETGISALTGNFEDTSSLKRWARATEQITETINHPFGRGWTAAGWAHSDFIQVAANLGLVAGLIFMGWYTATLVSAVRAIRRHRQDVLMTGLVCSFFVVGAMLLFEGVSVYPQLALPAWFIWALTDLRIQQLKHIKHEVIPA